MRTSRDRRKRPVDEPAEAETTTCRKVVVIIDLDDRANARELAKLAGVPEEAVLPVLDSPEKSQALRKEYQKLCEKEVLARAVLHDLLLPLAEEKYAKGEFEVRATSGWLDSGIEYTVPMGRVGAALHAGRFKKGDDPRSHAAWDARDGALLIVREEAKRVVASLKE